MGMGPQSPPPEPSAGGHDKYVALVSGLGLGLDGGNPLQLALVVDFLTGLLGGRDDQARAAQVRTCPGAKGALWCPPSTIHYFCSTHRR